MIKHIEMNAGNTSLSRSKSKEADYRMHPVGTYVDRTMKIIKWNYLRVFKDAGVDITTEQWVLLDKLYEENGQSQTDLANDTFKNAATVSRIIDLLCSKDLIERQRFENDRRRHKIYLKKKGERIVEKLRPLVFELRRKGWSDISEEEHQVFLSVINRIHNNFEQLKGND